MNTQILVTAKRYCDQFLFEYFTAEDDILLLLKEGMFSFSSPAGDFTVQKGEGALFRKNIPCQRKILKPITAYLFRFRSETPLFFSDHVVFSDAVRICDSMEMEERLTARMPHRETEFRQHLFWEAVYQYALEQDCPPGSRKSDPQIENAIRVMQKSIACKRPLSEIGETTGLSYVQFLRRFQTYTGLSPSVYMTELRLKKAKDLLENSDLLIKEIAAACGFENEYYFSNAFKKKMGISPTRYRSMIV